ncbi:hypothetical protein [Nocardiopsis alkaliphila]|uniref:hypothetical protein n=1 Tax=Nocardiopsis alkaliphila TaxID=225762 RepID=UPI0012697BA0|nr:hypothetical protein [Nocardiopsis alkaliphila]
MSAEIIETLGEKVRDAGARAGQRIRRAHRQRGERKSADPREQSKRYERELSREQRRIRREAANGDPLAQLELDTQRAQEQFIRYLRESDVTAPGQGHQARRRKLSARHQEYVSRMVAHCLKPLRRGVNFKNVLSTVGMSTAMWLLSPNFRAYVGDQVAQVATGMGWEIDRRSRREAKILAQGEKSRAKEAAHHARTGQGREGMSRRHRKRLERIERMERGDRDLFTERSAALAHVGIAQNAYDQMREPGADRELIKQNYESALSALYGYVDEDGLDREAVQRDMRVIVGRLIERDPAQAAVFSELGHGRFIKSEPQNVILPGTDRSAKLWSGDYVDAYAGDVITGGAFTLREPMSAEEHRTAVARTVYGELAGARGPAEFGEVLEQYAIGSATREYPESVELTEDPTARARLERSRAMFTSMREDGLSAQEQKLVHMGGVLEAWRELERTHPQMATQWSRALGPDWERGVRDLIEEYGDFDEGAPWDRERPQDARVRAEPKRDHWRRVEPGTFAETGVGAVHEEPAPGQQRPETSRAFASGRPPGRHRAPGGTALRTLAAQGTRPDETPPKASAPRAKPSGDHEFGD